MRLNQPVTQQEFLFDPDVVLMSTTDADSHIKYANKAFVDASGYEEDELYGQPHNLIRHPDMPPTAFADMWKTIQANEPWSGLVKNRRKNGDHYWVKANAVRVQSEGATSGYVSVRTAPSREEVKAAETLYANMRSGKLSLKKLHKGLLVYSGILSILSIMQTASLRTRVWTVLGVLLGGFIILASIFPGMELPVLAACAGFMVLCTGLLFEHQIIKPVKIIKTEIANVTSGQFHTMPSFNRVDELGIIMRCVNQTSLNMRSLVADVEDEVCTLRDATGQLVSGGNQLNQQTDKTTDSLQKTASALAEITSLINKSTENAKKVASLSTEAAADTKKGSSDVDNVVSMVEKIHQSSSRINEIVALIDSIAFKTNLLALNASVEAARAGEAGKGFAVVASEVRTLSEHTAQASKDIRSLVDTNRAEIDQGASLAGNAGQSMGTLYEEILKLTNLVQDISVAAVEQSIGINQISDAVDTIEGMTTGNATLVGNTMSIVNKLECQSRTLSSAISLYSAKNS